MIPILTRQISKNSTDLCKSDQSMGSFFSVSSLKFCGARYRVWKTGSARARPTSHLTATSIPVDYTTTEPNMPAGRVRSTGQHSNRFAKRAAEPNLVTAEPDKAEEPDQQRYDSFIKIWYIPGIEYRSAALWLFYRDTIYTRCMMH